MKEELIRAEFEKWYTQNDTPQTAARALERNNIGSYKLMHAHQSWLVWLAASAPLLERITILTQQAGDMEKLYHDTMFERDALALDAARYDFLRTDSPHVLVEIFNQEEGFECYYGIRLDEAIDRFTALQHKEQT